MKLRALLISFIAILVLAACSNDAANNKESDNTDSDNKNLKVYTTVFPLYSMTKEIAGDTMEVESIYPKNVNMHNYEPSQKDILNYAKGDLFIYTNHELDPVAKKIHETIENDTEVLEAFNNEEAFIEDEHHHDHDHDHDHDATEKEDEHDHDHDATEEEDEHDHDHGHDATKEEDEHDHDHDHEGEEHDDHEDHDHGHDHHHHGEFDPHVWLDPELATQMAENIKDKLVEMNPDEKETYEKNFESLKADLEELSNSLDEAMKDKKRDTVYISHESIGYLAHKYDFKQVGIHGLNDDEPSQKELTHMIEDIKETKTPYILREQNVSSRLTDMIGKETDVEFLPFHNLEALTDNDPEDSTYQSLMKENIETLKKALQD